MATKIGIKDVLAMEPQTTIWDSAVRGFHARRQYGGAITFAIFYRTQDQQQRWHRIGRFGVWTPEQARKEAQRVLRARDLGEDPSGERKALRNAITMAELCAEYVADMDAHRINGKKTSVYTDKSRIRKYIVPYLGKLRVPSVTQAQIEDFRDKLSSGSAKRIIGLTGAIFSYAIKKKIRADNPVSGIETPKDNRRMRRLSEAEYAQLWTVLNDGSNVAADIFLLLAVTGFRSGEARLLKHSELDLDRCIATLGDTKSGVSIRPLSSAAIEIIKRQPQTESEYVFPLQNGQPINRLYHHWENLGLDETITPHVLRHSFASLAADLGIPDHTISGLLGHKGQGITSRYLHIGDRTLLDAANLIANATLKLMKA